MYLFFDTETTGLPINWKAPVGKLDNWPRIVEIAWILTDKTGNELEVETNILKPDGFKIPADAIQIHGITNEIANEKGQDRVIVLKRFASMLDKAQVLIAHNIDFDKKVVHAEFMRHNIKSTIHKIDKLCTKELTTDYCRLPGRYGYKWPSLEELYKQVFDTVLSSSHSAFGDVKACKDCFFELINRGIIKLYGSKVLLNPISGTKDDDLIQTDDIDFDYFDNERTGNTDCLFFTKVRHLGLNEHKFLKARDEWALDEKIEKQVERFNIKWEKAKGKSQNNYLKQSKILEAEEKTKNAEDRLKQLETLLVQSVERTVAFDWEKLKNYSPFKEASPENHLQEKLDSILSPIPPEEMQIPPEPKQTDLPFQVKINFLDKYIFKSWQQRKIDQSVQKFQSAFNTWLIEKEKIEDYNKGNKKIYDKEIQEYNVKIEETKNRNKQEVAEWQKRKDRYYKDQDFFNSTIDQKKSDYLNYKSHSVIEYCELVLKISKYPDYFPKSFRFAYHPENNLIVDYSLPKLESFPKIKKVTYVKSEDSLKETNISKTILTSLYSNVIFQLAIRVVHELYNADMINAITTIYFNGYIKNHNPKYIISFQTDKKSFMKLSLRTIDCKEIIKKYRGNFTAKFEDIEPLIAIQL